MKITIVRNDVPVTIEMDASEVTDISSFLETISNPSPRSRFLDKTRTIDVKSVLRKMSPIKSERAEIEVSNSWNDDDISTIVDGILEGKRPNEIANDKKLTSRHPFSSITWHVYQAAAPGKDRTKFQIQVSKFLAEKFQGTRNELHEKYREFRIASREKNVS